MDVAAGRPLHTIIKVIRRTIVSKNYSIAKTIWISEENNFCWRGIFAFSKCSAARIANHLCVCPPKFEHMRFDPPCVSFRLSDGTNNFGRGKIGGVWAGHFGVMVLFYVWPVFAHAFF